MQFRMLFIFCFKCMPVKLAKERTIKALTQSHQWHNNDARKTENFKFVCAGNEPLRLNVISRYSRSETKKMYLSPNLFSFSVSRGD